MTNVYTPVDSSYKLIFDDEFSGNSINSSIWAAGSWDLQGTSGLSTPANTQEKECYNSSLVSVSGGYLHIAASSTPAILNGQTYAYQSGMLREKAYSSTYGYFEARVYLPPAATGVIANWPAWWLDGQNWPANGESDIVEGLGGQAGSTFHNAANPDIGYNQMATGDWTGWHNFGVLWTPNSMQYYYDGSLQHTVTTGITSSPMQMLFDYGIGGSGGPIVTPADMLVDYVHVYQSSQYDPAAIAITPQAGYGGPGDTGSTPQPPSTHTLTLRVSEDAYKGDAQFTVSVDGTQVGGTLTASALHSSGDSNVFLLMGNWGSGTHSVEIKFVNDLYAGTTTTDRNLYVSSLAYDGTTYARTTASLFSESTIELSVAGTTAVDTPPADTLTLSLSEDAYLGDANFQLFLDGKQVSTPKSVTALHSTGGSQAFTFSGNFGAGSHTVGVEFINDAYGGSASLDRNLYVNGISLNGLVLAGISSALYNNGTTNFTIMTTK